MEDFKELNHYLAANLRRVHAADRWQQVVYFFKEVERQREDERRWLEDMEREAVKIVNCVLEQWTFFIPVEFIVSQEACESRPTIYDQVQTQCCQFLKFLIKKELMFFTKGWLAFFATQGVRLFTIGKKLQLEK